MNRAPLIVAAATAGIAGLLAHWIGGWSGVAFASLFIVPLAWCAYTATAIIIHGRAPGTNPLRAGLSTWMAIIALVAIVVIAAVVGKYYAVARTSDSPAVINDCILAFSKQITLVENLNPDQRQRVADLVPPTLGSSASQDECRAAQLALKQAEDELMHLGLENERVKALAVAAVPKPVRGNVTWQELFVAEVRKNTLHVDEQLRRVAGGSLPYVVQEIDGEESITINPVHQSGVWYVGLPLSGLTGEDMARGLRGHFKNSVTSIAGMKHHFQVAGKPDASASGWSDLGELHYTESNEDNRGVFIQWKEGEKIPDETFTLTSSYVSSEWPALWQVRIGNLPSSDHSRRVRLPVTVVPTTVAGLAGSRVDSLVNILITRSDRRSISVSAEVWLGSASTLILKPWTRLSTIGEDNPALAIEHFCAGPVNVDITFLPRTLSPR